VDGLTLVLPENDLSEVSDQIGTLKGLRMLVWSLR